MKVLLVNPPRFDLTAYGLPTSETHGPPLGIASIAALLEKNGIDVKVADCYYKTWESVRDIITSADPAIVGITVLSQQRGSAYKLIRLIKEINPQIKIVLGGPHADYMYAQLLSNFPIDFVIFGEGEETLLDLVTALDGGRDVQSVKGIAYSDNGEIIRTGVRPLVADLDALPFPAYHLFNMSTYTGSEKVESGMFDGIVLRELPFGTYVSSRGCTGRCAFCSTYKFWGHRWRARSSAKVVDDLEILAEKFGRGYINIVDDIFTVDKKRVIEICKKIIERKLKILWDCETRVDFVSEELLRWMRKAGCVLVEYGVESASSEILEAIHKKTTPERITKAIRMTKNAGIKTTMLLMVGNPGESAASVSVTARMVRAAKPDFLTVSTAMVFPATPLYELAKSKKMVDDEYWLSEQPAPFYIAEVPLPKLRLWSDLLMSANANVFVKMIRLIRSYLGLWTGLMITRQGIRRYANDR